MQDKCKEGPALFFTRQSVLDAGAGLCGCGCYAYCAPGVAEIGSTGRESCDYGGWCCAKCDTRGGCAARNVVGGSKRRGITGIAPDRGQGQHRTALAGTDLYEVVGVGVHRIKLFVYYHR